jgi:hypothetical protein
MIKKAIDAFDKRRWTQLINNRDKIKVDLEKIVNFALVQVYNT